MTSPSHSVHPSYPRAASLGNEITELYGLITSATYDLLVMIGEFDAEGLWEEPGLCSCAHWLNWKCGIGMNAAREKVRVARALRDLPKISDAFRSGQVSYSKVRAMSRIAREDNEEYLLQIAHHGTAHHVETLVRGYRRATRLSDSSGAEKQLQARSFEYHWDDDGSLVFSGRLPTEAGALLLKALECSVDRAEQETDVTAETSPEHVTANRESISARRADALADLAETYVAAPAKNSSTADRYHVMLHVTAETSERMSLEDTYIEHGPHVTAETSKRLCCDASLSTLVTDRNGEPLSIGRKSRVIPAAMRRALRARDKQCRFPGCTHRRFIDGHHIRHWADGGETSLDNLVQLCRHHHRLVHEGGFRCGRNDAGNIVFSTPTGQVVENSVTMPPRYRGNVVADLQERLQDRFIHAGTCVTGWRGEKMDRHHAVGLLCDIDKDVPSSDPIQSAAPTVTMALTDAEKSIACPA